MSWEINGGHDRPVFGITDSGQLAYHGEGSQYPRPLCEGEYNHDQHIDDELLRRLRKADCCWSLYGTSESGVHIDPNGEGFLARVRASPDSLHGMVHFFAGDGDSKDLIGFRLVAPERVFEHIGHLLELVLMSERLEYSFAANFLGFRVSAPNTELPTWTEFVRGRPLFLSGYSLSVRQADAGQRPACSDR